MQDFKVQGDYVLWTWAILFVLSFIRREKGYLEKKSSKFYEDNFQNMK